MLSEERLQLPVMLSIPLELFVSARERIKQAQLRLRREQRLVIVRAVKINKFIAEIFQDRHRRRRTVDELARSTSSRETSLDDEIVLTRFDPSLHKLPV